MATSSPLQNEAPTTDTPVDSNKNTKRSQNNSTTTTASARAIRSRGLDSKTLHVLFPALIRWRLLIFYAPFYTGPKFTSPVLDTSATTTAIKIPPPRHLRQQHNLSISDYAAHKARKQANTILEVLRHHYPKVDILALHETYIAERSTHQLRRQTTGLTTTLLLPTLRAVTSAAKRLDLPLPQCELAMELFAQYVHVMRRNALAVDGVSRRAYDAVDARAVASDGDWARLARIVHDDRREVAAFRVFPRTERNTRGIWDVMSVFRTAVGRCVERYFEEVGIATGPAGGSGWRCQCVGVRKGEMARKHGGKNKSRGGVRRFFRRVSLPYRVGKIHGKKLCECGKITYRLSGREEVRRDRSHNSMGDLVQSGRDRCRLSSAAKLPGRVNSKSCRTIEKMPVIMEVIEDSE